MILNEVRNTRLRVTIALFLAGAGFHSCAAPRNEKPSPASPSPAIQFTEHLIMEGYAYPFGISAADLDGDGDLDLTSADALPHNDLYWFENDGTGEFSRRFIQKDDPERLERHGVGDINGDGHPDVVIVKNLHGDLLWFENSGSPRDGQLWKRRNIAKGTLPGAYDVALADLDGDGDLDVAASSWWLGYQFAWFENPGNPMDPAVEAWEQHLIEGDLRETTAIRAADFDADGDWDLLATAAPEEIVRINASEAGDAVVVWYENNGQPASGPWTRHLIAEAPRALHGQPVDLDLDGDLDVIMAAGRELTPGKSTHSVLWYENAGDPTQGPWPVHVIREPYENAFEADAADLDGDGDVDVVATGWGQPGRVAWFENGGDPKGEWTMHLLKDNWQRANQVLIADLDGDGDPDLAAVAERGSLEFRWWRNQGRQP